MADLDKVLDFFSEFQCYVFGGISRKIIRNAGFSFEQEISRKRHERQNEWYPWGLQISLHIRSPGFSARGE